MTRICAQLFWSKLRERSWRVQFGALLATMAREVVDHLNAVRSILQTLQEPQLSQMSENQSKQIDAKIRTLRGKVSPSDLAEICVAIGSVGFNSADSSRLQMAVSESTAEQRGSEAKYQNFENMTAYLPEWLWDKMATETGYTDLIEFLVDLGLVSGTEGTFQIATILLLLASEGRERAQQHTGKAKNTFMKSVKRWFLTTITTKSGVATPPLLMHLPRDPRDFQRLNPERYEKCYSKGEAVPCKFEWHWVEFLREGNWMRLGKCQAGGKAAAAKNEPSLALADGSQHIVNALQSFMNQQNMLMQSLMNGQLPKSFGGPRIEILGDQQRVGGMLGLPQSAPALGGRVALPQSAPALQRPQSSESLPDDALQGALQRPQSSESSPALAKPALFHQVPDAPAAPQTTLPLVHVSVAEATKTALSAFHARAETKEEQKKAEREQKAAERKKEREEKAAEKAAEKKRERDAKGKQKERLRLKEVAAKEKARLQFLAMKSSRAAKAESRTPSEKPPTKGKVKTETAKTTSDKTPSKVKAESKRKADPKEKTPQTKSDDVSKIKLEKEGTRNHFLLRTGVKRRGEGSVLFPYDPKERDSEETAKKTALNYLRDFCKYNETPLPLRGISS